MEKKHTSSIFPFFKNSEVGRFIIGRDWTNTSLGAIDRWPQSLYTALNIITSSPFPTLLLWGSDFNCLYNDAHKHTTDTPFILGNTGKQIWAENWPVLESVINQVIQTGEPLQNTSPMVPLDGTNLYYSSMIPIWNELGHVGGVMVTYAGESVIEEENRKQLQFAIEASELATWDLNPATNRFVGNARLKEWFGLAPDVEIDLTRAIASINEKDQERVAEAIQKALQISSGGQYDIEYQLTPVNGKPERIVRAKGKAFFTEEGIAYRFNGILQDITSEVKIREDQQKLLSLVENSADYMAVSSIEGDTTYISYINKAGRQLLGLDAEQDISTFHGKDFFTPEHFQTITDQVLPALAQKGKWSGRISLKHILSQEVIPCHADYVSIKDPRTGQTIARGATVRDLRPDIAARNALAESEQRFGEYIKASPVPMAIYMGREMIVQTVNDALLKTWDKDSSVVGRTFREALPELEGQPFYQLLDDVYMTGIPYHTKDDRVDLLYNGQMQTFYFNFSYTPLKDTSGKVYGILNTATDVTEMILAKRQSEESENLFRNLILEASIPTALLTGPEFKVELANDTALKLWGKRKDIIGKTFQEALPELEGQPYLQILSDVYKTGLPYEGKENLVYLERNGELKPVYINFVYKALPNVTERDRSILVMGYEITDQIEARQKISDTEERARLAIEAGELGTFDLDMQTDLLNCSPRFYEIFGVESNADRKTVTSKIHPSDQELRRQAHKKALLTGKLDYEARILWSDDSIHWIKANGKVYYNTDGKPVRLLGTVLDITEQKQALQKLEASESDLRTTNQRLQIALDAARLGSYELDIPSGIIQCNDQFRSNYGLKNDSVFYYHHLVESILPEDRAGMEQAVAEALQNRSVYHSEYQIEWPDHSRHWIKAFGKGTYNEAGEPIKMIGVSLDITEQILSQQTIATQNEDLNKLVQDFTFVTNFIPQLVWSTHPDGYHDFYNQRWYDYTGLTAAESQGIGWNSVVHPEDQERARQTWNHSLATGELYEIEYRFKRHDGAYRWFLGRALPLKDEKGVITKWFGTCTDIEDQKKLSETLEQKVQERTKELQRSNNELQQFAYVASHDLQEPLRKIKTFSELLKMHLAKSNEQSHTYLERIIVSSTRMMNLIKDVLHFSRLSKTGEEYVQVDLNLSLSLIRTDFELLIAEKEAIIIVDVLPSIQAIPLQINQLFTNLISNSLKFSRKDESPIIRISYKTLSALEVEKYPELDPNLAYIELEFKDNGIGFDQQYAEQIFTIFQRLHDRQTYSGTGIGLALCRKIAVNHHGTIHAVATEGSGATFYVILPLQQPA